MRDFENQYFKEVLKGNMLKTNKQNIIMKY